jgi:S-adenosylmethionine:tRNA ribosyltransferase-isomerase
MIAADRPVQRPPEARLLVIDALGRLSHRPRARFVELLQPGDLVVANDAATLPASLHGTHLRSGRTVEVRLAGRASLARDDVHDWAAIVFGEGDHRTRTEDRPPPPALQPGDLLALGRGRWPLYATVLRLLDHPRFVALRLHGTPDAIWAGLARHGKPVQYAHVPEPLQLWDVWTPVAGAPVAFEPPSAGFALDWAALRAMRERGVGFATLTHAAGLSSTGDAALDARLPLDEPYEIPPATVRALHAAWARGGRIVAVGTTVVRALEHAASRSRGAGLPPGPGVATQKIGPHTRLQVVDVLLSGTHEAGTSHYELLRAFADDQTLRRADQALHGHGYRTHEFGDSVWVEHCRVCADERRPQALATAA